MRVVSYSRVSTAEQGQSGLGLEAQRQTIVNTARARGWEIVAELADTSSGKTLQRRPSLAEALRMVESGEADALVAAKLDRISRSLLDFAGLVERARKHGWALVALDSPADMSTPQGELVAGVFASFAQFERRIIGERTRAALAVKREQGARLGRPQVMPATVRDRIRAEHQAGASLRAIARGLNEDGTPTAHGGREWHASTVRKALLPGG